MKLTLGYFLFSQWLLATHSFAQISFFSQTQYTGREDNPILGIEGIISYVEDFEGHDANGSNALTTPHAIGWNGASAGSPGWGVQQDFKGPSGEVGIGWVWTSSGLVQGWIKAPAGIHFDFTPDGNGRFPEYAGAALLGRGITASGPDFNVILVYDAQGREVTNGEWRIPKPNYDLPYNQEDLFLNFEGIYVQGGISSIHFRDFLEVDHLTYGYAIPEISTSLLTLAAGTLMFARRSRSGTTGGN